MFESLAQFTQVSVHVADVLDRIKNREDQLSRWAVLVGAPHEELYEHMVDRLLALPNHPRLTLVRAFTIDAYLDEQPEVRQWIEGHMVARTPAILLLRKGELEAMIAGAVSQRTLDDAVKQLCTERAGDRLQERIEELTADGGTLVLPKATEYVQVGVTEDGQPLYVRRVEGADPA